MDKSPVTPAPIPVPQPPVDAAAVAGRVMAICMTIYAVIAVAILLGHNVPGAIGDYVQWLTLPMLGIGGFVGVSMLSYGVTVASSKNRPMIIRILAPLVGLVVGAILFAAAAYFAITASLSNVTEGGVE